MKSPSLEHWFSDKQSKLAAWREWRTHLVNLDVQAAYQETAIWWKFVPIVNKTFDPWHIESWPDPWKLIGNGSFCPNAQGLGMFYSLVLCSIDCELILAMVEGVPRLMVNLPGSKLLNYYDGEVIDINTVDAQILQLWTASDLARLVKV